MSDVHLDIQNVCKTFGAQEALRDINLKINRGEFVCLLGPSGCGKTTLLRIIAGFEHATSGRLLLDGQDISDVPPHKRDFGMVFQSLALFPHMSVAENIAYGLKLRGVDGQKRKARVDELLNVVHLPHIADRLVSQLSGGQRQRVAIARALAVQPKLFLLDEPLSALDAQLRDSMQIELRILQQEFGVTTILVTHDQAEAMMLADRLVVLKNGQLLQAGAPMEVYRQPVNPFTAEFLGAANILPARIGAGGRLELLGLSLDARAPHAEGQAVDVAIRAEDVRLSPDNAAGAPASVDFVRDLGGLTELIVVSGEHRLRARSHDVAMRSIGCGDSVYLHFDPATLSVFPR